MRGDYYWNYAGFETGDDGSDLDSRTGVLGSTMIEHEADNPSEAHSPAECYCPGGLSEVLVPAMS